MLFRIEWTNRVHYPYARTNGASRGRVVSRALASASAGLLHVGNVNTPTLLVTIL